MTYNMTIDGLQYLSPREFAYELHVTSQAVLKWLFSKKINGIKIGSRYWIPLNEIIKIKKSV